MIGNSPSQNIKIELVTLLCLADRTHSQLMESMPEKCGAAKSPDFDIILGEVSSIFEFRPNFIDSEIEKSCLLL